MTMQPLEHTQMSLEEYEAFLALPEHADKAYELVHGEVVEKMNSFIPSRIAGLILTFLNIYLLQQNSIGYATGEQGGYRLGDSVFIPDVAYISKARLPELPEREAPIAPDLAVEVKSPSDSKRKLRQKAEYYLAHGTKMVWLVLPDEEKVEVYTPEQDVIELGLDGVLEGGEVLPQFTLAIKEIFS